MGVLRTFSYGGGVQSTAALVLQAEGRIDFPVFLFCNVGEDSENPDTLAYFERYAKPFAADRGIELHELRKVRRGGDEETLMGRLTREGSRSVPIPVRMSNGAPGTRQCTEAFKINVVAKWLREHGATPDRPAVTGLGISVDEVQRARSDSGIPYQVLEYPLLTLALRRSDCVEAIRRAGLPVPPKSACYFCPMHRPSDWARMLRERPEQFAAAAELERLLNRRRETLGKDPVWLSRFNAPLDEVFGHVQEAFDFEEFDGCESGYCMT